MENTDLVHSLPHKAYAMALSPYMCHKSEIYQKAKY